MSLIDRLIGAAVLRFMLLVSFVAAAATLLATFIDEVGARSASYDLAEITIHVALLLPERVLQMLPLIAITGTLLGLSSLSTTSELVVMRATGVSRARLALAACAPVGLFLLIAALLSETLAPRLAEHAETRKQSAIAGGGMLWLPRGRWQLSNGRFVHARALGTAGEWYGLSIFEPARDVPALERIRYARVATPIDASRWRLEDVRGTAFAGPAAAPSAEHAEHATLAMRANLSAPRMLMQPAQMSLAALRAEINGRGAEGLDAREYALAFWMRIMQAPGVLAVTILALGLVVGPTRSLGVTARLAMAVALGVGMRFAMDLTASLSLVYGLDAWLAAALPVVVAAIAATVLARA